jgi:hypothetical protein
MFRLRTGISLIAVFVLTATAHATPITFSLENGIFGSGATMSGTVVIDTATGSLVSADLTYTLGGSSVTFDRAFFGQTTLPALFGVPFPVTLAGVLDGPGSSSSNPPTADEFDLLLPVPSLVGYTGGPVCNSGIEFCGGQVFTEYYGRVNFVIDHGLSVPGNDALATGNLVPFTVTPEPSEFALTLTGTALCAFMGFGRFRRMQTETTAVRSFR